MTHPALIGLAFAGAYVALAVALTLIDRVCL